jgi:hypothetical protein
MNRPLIEAIDQESRHIKVQVVIWKVDMNWLNWTINIKVLDKDKAPSVAGYFYVLFLIHCIEKLIKWQKEDDK